MAQWAFGARLIGRCQTLSPEQLAETRRKFVSSFSCGKRISIRRDGSPCETNESKGNFRENERPRGILIPGGGLRRCLYSITDFKLSKTGWLFVANVQMGDL